jgi:hypothetical protein
MPLVLLLSLFIGTGFALWPRWQFTKDRDLLYNTRPRASGEDWIELYGPTMAIVRAGAPFTAYSATVDLERLHVRRPQPMPHEGILYYCYDWSRSIKAVAVHDGESSTTLPTTFASCEIRPQQIHAAGLVGNILFAAAVCSIFGWMLLFVASRPRASTPDRCACGYHLAGLSPGTPCPECGALAPTPRPSTPCRA